LRHKPIITYLPHIDKPDSAFQVDPDLGCHDEFFSGIPGSALIKSAALPGRIAIGVSPPLTAFATSKMVLTTIITDPINTLFNRRRMNRTASMLIGVIKTFHVTQAARNPSLV
jgi:hypothetical protein